jgi:AcrR family transcriptional regulator
MSGPVASKGRKRAAHLGPERRRPEVLDAALTLFLERGYQGTSMEAIAGAAGVTKPVVYACFAGKDELFRSLLAREEERILGEIQSAFEGTDFSDPESTLVEGYTGFLRAVAASPDVYRLIFLGEGGGNMAVAKRIQRGREDQAMALAALVRRWIEERDEGLPPAEVDAKARLLGSSLTGLAESSARLMLSEPGRWTSEDLGRQVGRFAAVAQAAV